MAGRKDRTRGLTSMSSEAEAVFSRRGVRGVCRLELTAAGRRTFRGATRAGDHAVRQFLAPLSEQDAERLAGTLRTLIRAGRRGEPV